MVEKEGKKEINMVHKQAILCETIDKELKHQKLYTKYFQNPYKKVNTVAGKPNSYRDCAEGEEDKEFLKLNAYHTQQPVNKYTEPITTSQEYGWMHDPLVKINRDDSRLHWGKRCTELTTYKEKAWSLGEPN